jgi:hypothetical protein
MVVRRGGVPVADKLETIEQASAIAVVYKVEPEGSIEDDPDVDTPGISFQCQKAKIVAIHEIPLHMLLAAQRLLLQYRAGSGVALL